MPHQVSRQLVTPDIYGETAVMLSVRSGSQAIFFSVIGRLNEEQVGNDFGRRQMSTKDFTPIKISNLKH